MFNTRTEPTAMESPISGSVNTCENCGHAIRYTHHGLERTLVGAGTANERLRAESWTDPDLGFAVVPLQDAEREMNLLYGIIERLAEVAARAPAGLDVEKVARAIEKAGYGEITGDLDQYQECVGCIDCNLFYGITPDLAGMNAENDDDMHVLATAGKLSKIVGEIADTIEQ